jgi:uncharacterized protein YbjT (DUF2867 family)
MRIAIIGASGFIGRHLTQHLLETSNVDLVLVAPDVQTIELPVIYRSRTTLHPGSVLEPTVMEKALRNIDVAIYLVHMMATTNGDYADLETRAATITGQVAQQVGLPRLIYMSGLGDDQDNLSKHLASRHRTGDILRQQLEHVVEFRASMVIGPGSISFDIVRHLIQKLPILLLPRWVITETQPIGLDDVLNYLTAAITNDISGHEIIEIGGPKTMSYLEFLNIYATWSHKRRLLLRIPFIPTWLAGWWLDLFTTKHHARVGRAMVESFRNRMVVTNTRAQELFPDIHPAPIEHSFFT